MLIKSFIFFFAFLVVYCAPPIRSRQSQLLNKAYLTILVFNLIGAYYGFIMVAFTRIPIWSDFFLLGILIAIVVFCLRSTNKFGFAEKIFRLKSQLKHAFTAPLNRQEIIFILLASVHVISLFYIHFAVAANPLWQGADIVEGRFGSRSSIHNSFPYLKYSLLYLSILFMGELSILLYYGVIVKRIRYVYLYLAVILILIGFTTAANFTFFIQRDQWRHTSAVYSLLKNNHYAIWYLGDDVTSRDVLWGGVPLPKRFLIGTATSYASNYGFYYFLASAFRITGFDSFSAFYRLFHPLWWQFCMLIALLFFLKAFNEFTETEIFLMICVGLVSIYGLTMANLNFPQYTTAPIFLAFFEQFSYVITRKRQYLILLLLAFGLMFSYASYALLFIVFLPLIYYWFARKGVKKAKSIALIYCVFAASSLAVFTYYLGNFQRTFSYSLSELWKPALRALSEMISYAVTGAYFFNSAFIVKIYTLMFTPPLLWRILIYASTVLLIALFIIKTKKITFLHLFAAVTLCTYSFMFKFSTGENLLIQRLRQFIGLSLLLVIGCALGRGIENTRFYYKKILILVVIVVYGGLSFLSFINIVHSTNKMAYTLIQTFYEGYGNEAKSVCFVADDADLVVLEAVSAGDIREGNFRFSDSRYTKYELIAIRDNLVYKENKQPLVQYQKKYGIKTCYAMNSYEHFSRFNRLFGAPILKNDLFAIWEFTI